ncbi:MAG: hypothetical protein KDJ45_11360 [Hyphomicrobiaceae bacterium]|nr:hypothetical protein [Hyphomicrobiaceae bacterium]MCC0010287.1 hypothetical protein [Hyphomicrobiaceae bacterium]
MLKGVRADYERRRDLPRLIAVWPHEIESDDDAVRVIIMRKLRAALRAERQRGLAGHWTYDVTRHAQLARAYRNELTRLGGKGPSKGETRNKPRVRQQQSKPNR